MFIRLSAVIFLGLGFFISSSRVSADDVSPEWAEAIQSLASARESAAAAASAEAKESVERLQARKAARRLAFLEAYNQQRAQLAEERRESKSEFREAAENFAAKHEERLQARMDNARKAADAAGEKSRTESAEFAKAAREHFGEMMKQGQEQAKKLFSGLLAGDKEEKGKKTSGGFDFLKTIASALLL